MRMSAVEKRDGCLPPPPEAFTRGFAIKRRLAAAGERLGVNAAGMAILRAGWRNRFVRIVNYHSTPACDAIRLREHLRFYRQHFHPCAPSDLDAALTGGWRQDRPGLIITFDDGLRCNHDIAAPLLEEFGFSGWFFVPAGFVDAPVESQERFAREHRIPMRQRYVDGRVAMSWEEVRSLLHTHAVGCHTLTHRRFSAAIDEAELDREVVVARARMEGALGREIDAFCWVGGEEEVYAQRPAAAIRAAGFRYAFMTCSAPVGAATDPLQLQRTNVETWWSLDLVRFQLSGAMDLLHMPKRRRVVRATR